MSDYEKVSLGEVTIEDLIKEPEKYPKNATVSIPHEHFGYTTDFGVYYNKIINQVSLS